MIIFRVVLGAFLSSMAIWALTRKKVVDQANDYFPVQSDSERAAGHPLVGSV
jgi:5-bromo-4-chloroindolyl phosphate hydrolysis protein